MHACHEVAMPAWHSCCCWTPLHPTALAVPSHPISLPQRPSSLTPLPLASVPASAAAPRLAPQLLPQQTFQRSPWLGLLQHPLLPPPPPPPPLLPPQHPRPLPPPPPPPSLVLVPSQQPPPVALRRACRTQSAAQPRAQLRKSSARVGPRRRPTLLLVSGKMRAISSENPLPCVCTQLWTYVCSIVCVQASTSKPADG